MNSTMRVLSLIVVSVVMVGCETSSRPAPAASDTVAKSSSTDTGAAKSSPAPIFVLHSSGPDTFLLNADTGKVWRWNSKEEAFIEVPITSKITKFERGPDGQLREKKANPKDPLGLFEEQEGAKSPKR